MKTSPRHAFVVVLCLSLPLLGGCTHLAQDVAAHLTENDVHKLDQDFVVIQGDLAHFRSCLKTRGGSCEGSASTALPHSTQHADAQSVAAHDPGSSQALQSSVDALPAGHGAKTAHAVLSHPLVAQATTVHDHLRGHDVDDTGQVSPSTADDGSRGSTVTMNVNVGHAQGLFDGLLSSFGIGAWDALHEHCETLQAHPDMKGDKSLVADCRRVAFIRGYLGAYLRDGHFLDVKVELAGAVKAINDDAQHLEDRISKLQSKVDALIQDVDGEASKGAGDVAADVSSLAKDLHKLVTRIDDDVARALGGQTQWADDFTTWTGELESRADGLVQSAGSKANGDIHTAAKDLDQSLGKITSALDHLQAEIQGLDTQLVESVDDAVSKDDAKLSNVFKVSTVGFMSRDTTFQARLPTVGVTVDPTVKQWLEVQDVDHQEILTSHSNLSNLGVATDTSGVGTGSDLGAELVRVFLEAVFDASEGLPAFAPSNLNGLRPTGLALGDRFSLPLFASPLGSVDSGDVSRMTHFNNAVALKTRLLVGRLISGIGPFNLNNEPLEDFITEIVATSVRKAAEKASWCWYACNLDQDLKQAEDDLKQAADDKIQEEKRKLEEHVQKIEKEIEDAVQQEDHRLEQNLRKELESLEEQLKALEAEAEREAEHVKLRLKLSS